MSASIGIALFPEHGRTTAELLRRADVAMYDAKRSGSGHAVFDAAQEEQTRASARAAERPASVRRPRRAGRFTTSPRSTWRPREITGVEALVRWQHPDAGSAAARQLHARGGAHRTDRAGDEMGAQRGAAPAAALARARASISRWPSTSPPTACAPSSDLPDTVAELTDIWGTAPDRLILELTESALIEAAAPRRPDSAARDGTRGCRSTTSAPGTRRWPTCSACRSTSSRSTGPSSRTSRPVPGDAVIVRSTIDLAHNLGLTVVAEGVEDETALDMLVEYGCDSAQGYFFSRPRPADQLTTWLTESPYGAPVEICA